MSVSSQFVGKLVGYSMYEKTNKETGAVTATHTYSVLVQQRPDSATKIPTECALFEIREDHEVLGDKLKLDAKVTFWQSERMYRDENGRMQRMTVCEFVEAV